uniref:BTB domain-containing protein n=1 Tax=Panagrolaimus sp. JU765 TaxID=591449 RepID=A0AC34RAU2_9BILA
MFNSSIWTGKNRQPVNLPPLSRIEQNSLCRPDGTPHVAHKVNSDKFLRYSEGSPDTVSTSAFNKMSSEATNDVEQGGSSMEMHQRTETEEQPQSESTQKPEADEPTELDKLRNEVEVEDVEARIPPEKTFKSSVKVEDVILRLNIGGASYRIRTRSVLRNGPNTLLGRLCRMDHEHRRQWADGYFEDSDEYFFERVPRYFDPIYDFYAAGKLHVPKDLCFEKFMAELRFWAVSKAKMDECCSPFAQYCLMRKSPMDQPEKDHFIGLRCAKIRRRLWLILEGHSHSRWWKLFEITSTSFVVLSITALILGSIPEFQIPEPRANNPHATPVPVTYPTYPKVNGYTVSTTTVVKDGEDSKQEMVEHPVFNYVENICVVYFTLEYLLRLWVAPRKLSFIKEFLNIIDLLAIAPFMFEVILILIGISGENVRKVRWAFLTVRLLRVLRVVRIAKLGRFSPGLANFALTLRKSKKHTQMVGVVMLTIIIFFSTLIYFLEKDEPNTQFTSIPAAFWWCLFSQTKWVPQTAAGKLVGGAAIISGVLVLALPITIMVSNFMQVVKLREEKIIKRYAQQHGDHV